MTARGVWYRRVIVSCMTLLAALMLQVHWAVPLENGDHTMGPVPMLIAGGVEKTEAQLPGSRVGEPAHFRVPAIGIDAPIVRVGLLSGGRMDAPPDALSVGWYVHGVRPGEYGTAVFDGHLELGHPGVFWDLHRLKPGDVLLVTDDGGIERTFRVAESREYDVSAAPMEKIFAGDASVARLNLITCAGTWKPAIGHYDRRLVVFAVAED